MVQQCSKHRNTYSFAKRCVLLNGLKERLQVQKFEAVMDSIQEDARP